MPKGPAARKGDMVLHTSPHCHAPIHPSAPTPTPLAHPPIPFKIMTGSPDVKIGGKEAAIETLSITEICKLPSCIPNGPGLVFTASKTVKINGMGAARVGDTVQFPGCILPIPSPTAKIIVPGAPTVIIGG